MSDESTTAKSAKVIKDEAEPTPQQAYNIARSVEMKRHAYVYFQHPDTGANLALCACREEPFDAEIVGDHIEADAEQAGRAAREHQIAKAVAAHKDEPA